MGHYRLITGYDDPKEEWILYDSLQSTDAGAGREYRGIRLSYETIDTLWRVFNRLYIVVYDAESEPIVKAIVSDDMNDQTMWAGSLQRASQEVETRPGDAFAWFTLGTNLLAVGRPMDAASAYDQARLIGLPFRTMWYQFGAFEAYYESGRYDEVVALADATIKVTADVEELHFWRGRALAAMGDVEGARQALERALAQRLAFPEALDALQQLAD
jgi:tetratricopeptide (TPR) repeat protein